MERVEKPTRDGREKGRSWVFCLVSRYVVRPNVWGVGLTGTVVRKGFGTLLGDLGVVGLGVFTPFKKILGGCSDGLRGPMGLGVGAHEIVAGHLGKKKRNL